MFETLVPPRRMAQVVEGMASHFAKEHGLDDLGINDRFEAFAAYCIVKRHSHDFEPRELRSGGSGDLGIDAYAVIIDGDLYTDPLDVADYVAGRNQIQVRFVIIQAKREIPHDPDAFAKLANGIIHVFSEEELDPNAGKGVSRLREFVKAIYEDARKFEAHGRPLVDVWYAYLGRYRATAHTTERIAAKDRLEATELFRRAEVTGVGAIELRNEYRNLAPGLVATLKLPKERRIELPPPVVGVTQSFVGVVKARDLVDNLLLDENKERRLHLYDENLRDFLTDKNPVNTEIMATLADDDMRGGFAVLNNGVTIVVSKLTPSATEMVLRGPRVVNGCQTCNVLATNRDRLTDGVMVNVRIIESSDPQLVTAIVRATNRQTAIAPDAFDGRDKVQQHIEEFCATREGREVYFERRLNQYGATKVASDVINRRHMTQAFGAVWLGIPHKVFSYRALAAGKYGPIFADSHDSLLHYIAASAYLNVGRLIGSAKGVAPQFRPALFHLLYGLRLMDIGPDPVQLKGAALEKASKRILDAIWDPDGLRAILTTTLVPAVNTALDGQSLSELGSAVRDDKFTERFRRAVLEQPSPDGQRLLQPGVSPHGRA